MKKNKNSVENSENGNKKLHLSDVMHSLAYKSHTGVVIAIVFAKEWFKQFYAENKMPYFITENDYVVCKWHDYHDGEKSNIEGKQTIAICKNKHDAEIVYNSNCA